MNAEIQDFKYMELLKLDFYLILAIDRKLNVRFMIT